MAYYVALWLTTLTRDLPCKHKEETKSSISSFANIMMWFRPIVIDNRDSR